jgi:hypothetical protein
MTRNFSQVRADLRKQKRRFTDGLRDNKLFIHFGTCLWLFDLDGAFVALQFNKEVYR